MLTEEQTKRLLGISHLEGGTDPLLIIDELLDQDSDLRKTYKLSFQDTKLVVDFLKTSAGRGWLVHSNPNIVECVTHLWNCGVQNLEPNTVDGLIAILKDLKSSGWDPSNFVKEATGVSNLIYYYKQYKKGSITVSEFQQKAIGYL